MSSHDKRADNVLYKKMWDTIYKDMSVSLQKDIKTFIKEAPDDQTRVEFFKDVLDSCSFKYASKYDRKDGKSALRAFNRGVLVMEERSTEKLHEALKEFTRCITDFQDNIKFQRKLAACALHYRAAVLISLGNFENALADLQLINRCYLDALNLKMLPEYYYNRHVTLTLLKQYDEAQHSYDIFEKLAYKADVPPLSVLYPQFQTHEEAMRLVDFSKFCIFSYQRPPPTLSHQQNAELLSASSCVQLQHHSTPYGRHLTAARDIQAGDVILVENAVAFSINPYDTLTFCHHCFKPCHGPYPCSTCNLAVYCSQKCSQLAHLKYHYTECLILSWMSRTAFLECDPLIVRLICTLGIDKLKGFNESTDKMKMDNNLIHPRTKGFTNSVFDPSTIQAVYSLVTNSKSRDTRDYCANTLLAAHIVKCIENTINIEDIGSIGGIILHLIQVLYCNRIHITQYGRSNNSFDNQPKIGSGLYPTAALINHSCDANLFHYFHGSTIVIRAIKNISKGEQLFMNYGVSVSEDSHKKNLMFRERYNFKCTCKLCQEDYHKNYRQLPSVNMGVSAEDKRKVQKSLRDLVRGVPYKDQHPVNLKVCAGNIRDVFKHLHLMEKVGMSTQMDYLVILEHVKEFYAGEGNVISY